MRVGEWPFCPHGVGVNAIEPDDWPGGKLFENGFDVPTRFYSKSEHKAALDARGLEVRAKWAGPLDKYLTRMDAPSAKTLEDAKVLLERGVEARRSAKAEMDRIRAEYPITVTEVKS